MGNETKQILEQYGDVKRMLDDLKDQLHELNERLITVRSCQITGMPRGGMPVTNDLTADLVSDIMELEKRIDKFEKIASQKREIVQSYIDTVYSPKHNRVLTMHYIYLMPLGLIADRENYSIRHLFRIYSDAIAKVDTSIDL